MDMNEIFVRKYYPILKILLGIPDTEIIRITLTKFCLLSL